MNVPISFSRSIGLAGMGSRLLAATWLLLALPALAGLALSALVATGAGPVLTHQRRFRRDGSPVDLARFRATPGGLVERFGADRVAELLNVARGEIALFGARPLMPGNAAPADESERRTGLIDVRALRA